MLCEWVACLAALKRKQRSGFWRSEFSAFHTLPLCGCSSGFALLPSSYVHWATDGELMSERLHLAYLSCALFQKASSCSSLYSVDSSPGPVCWVLSWNPVLPSDVLTVALGLWVFVHVMLRVSYTAISKTNARPPTLLFVSKLSVSNSIEYQFTHISPIAHIYWHTLLINYHIFSWSSVTSGFFIGYYYY